MRTMLKRIACLLLPAVLAGACAIPAAAYRNPIPFTDTNGRDCAMGDPFVMKFNGTYYAYGGGKCFRSDDMVRWTCVGNAFSGEHSENLYAPEIFYFNGAFYCISCPNGTENHLFKSDSPEGPFMAVGGPLGGDIDGSLFRDDDGTVYFLHAAWNGIELYRMETPESEMTPVKRLSPSISEMWTEGPGLFKRNGKYYLTYTGNHVLDPAYRVEYAVADRITGPWTEPEQNILLLSTEGSVTGLGHNCVVIGPDLDSYYIVYHNRYPDGTKTIDRGFNMQRILWNGDKPVVSAQTVENEEPDRPDYEFRPENGTTIITAPVLSDKETGEIFTTEFNAVPRETVFLFSVRGEDGCRLSFTEKTAVLEIRRGGQSEFLTAELPKNTDTGVLQCLRVQQTGTALRLFLAGGQFLETTPRGSGAIGYDTVGSATVGYAAFSDKALGNRDHEAKKYALSVCDAVLADEKPASGIVPAEEPGNAVLLEPGQSLRFDLTALSASTVTLSLRGRAGNDTSIRIDVDGTPFVSDYPLSAGGGYRTEALRSLSLTAKTSSLVITVLSGRYECYEIATTRESRVPDLDFSMNSLSGLKMREGTVRFQDGKAAVTASESPKGDCYAKAILGDAGWGDYSVEATLICDTGTPGAEAGLFIRSANETDGEACAFRFRRKWYQQCYYVCLSEGYVSLYKQNYGEKLLARKMVSFDLSVAQKLKIAAVKNVLTVYLNGKEILSYTDNDHPFLNGKAGLKVVNGTAYYDDLSIRAISAESPAPSDTAAPQPSPGAETGSKPAAPDFHRNAILPIGLLLLAAACAVGLRLFFRSRKKR